MAKGAQAWLQVRWLAAVLLGAGLAAAPAPPTFQIDTAAPGATKADTWRIEVVGAPKDQKGGLIIAGTQLTVKKAAIPLDGAKSYALGYSTPTIGSSVKFAIDILDADGYRARYQVAGKISKGTIPAAPVFQLLETTLPCLGKDEPQPPLRPDTCTAEQWTKVQALVRGVLATDWPANGSIQMLQPRLSDWDKSVALKLAQGKADPNQNPGQELRFLRPPAENYKPAYRLNTHATNLNTKQDATDQDYWTLGLVDATAGGLIIDGKPLKLGDEVQLAANQNHGLDFTTSKVLGLNLRIELKDSRGRAALYQVTMPKKVPVYKFAATPGGPSAVDANSTINVDGYNPGYITINHTRFP